jgi:outer membrane biosynthesis protein TonB
MWAVLYDDGTSLTTVSEPIARSLAEAERQRGHRVTIRCLDDDADGAQASEPEPALTPEPASAPEPAQKVEPTPAPEAASVPEPAQKVEPTPTPTPTLAPEPARAVEPAQAVELAPVPKAARESEPARAARPAKGRRLLLYALAAGCIVVAAAMADHWDVLPRVGATTSSSPAQVGGPSHRSQLIPPLDQPPVMHFSNAVRGEPSATAIGG